MADLAAPITQRKRISNDAGQLFASQWLAVFSLTLVVLLTYWGVWRSYFQSDDLWALGWVRFQANAWDGLMTEMRLGAGIRPLMDLNLWLRFRLFGLDAAPYFVISVAQHLVVVGLVYWLGILLYFPRLVAWLGALLFGTSSSAHWVVHWITGSNMSLGAMFGLLALCLFIVFRRGGNRLFLWLWIVCVGVMLFTNEYFATVLPMFVVYDLVVALRELELRKKVKALLVHLCYLIWLIPYALLQLHFASQGMSEYRDLVPGLDIALNYGYLVYLALPYLPGASIPALITYQYAGSMPTTYIAGALVLAIALFVAAVYLLWRGARVQRYLVIWIGLSFFPFVLWPFASGLSAASRYRYVPTIAFSMLVASGLMAWWSHDLATGRGRRWLVPVFVLAVLLSNVFFHQSLNRKQVRNGAIKREVVELLVSLPEPPEGARLVLEVPDMHFDDLEHVCELVYATPMECITVLEGKGQQIDDFASRYWMSVSYDGVQVSEGWQ